MTSRNPLIRLAALCMLSLLAAIATAEPLTDAYALYNTGKYVEAVAAYEKLAKADATRAAATTGLARVALQTGTYKTTLAKVEAALKTGAAKDADLLAAKATLLVRLGRYAEASQAVASAVAADAKHVQARLLTGELLEAVGQIDKAVAAYRWFETLKPKTAEQMTATGKALMRIAHLTGKKISPQAKFALTKLYQNAVKLDPSYWPARVAAGNLLARKFNLREAADEFKLALKTNPNLPDVIVTGAFFQLSRFKFEAAETALTKAFEINPNHVRARVARALILLRTLRMNEVEAPIREALKINPNDTEALATLTALFQRTGRKNEAGELVERVKKVNATPFEFHEMVAELNSWGRQYPRTEAHYRKALKLAPNSANIMNGLGRMLMETGRVEEAFPLLEKAHKLDGFNRRTLNTLNLLDSLLKYHKQTSTHFVVKLDKDKDEILAALFSDYLESITTELTRRYDHQLKGTVFVEIYPKHTQFGVRMTGRPAVRTIGACFGNVIAMDSPRPGVVKKRFNWARVLRHEFTHTVTLGATENRISHWFTEACAVTEERRPRRWLWCKMLAGALSSGRLFPISELTWGFVRPRRRGDRILAYAQAQWTYEFIQNTFGSEKINALLVAYKNKHDQAAIFQDVFNMTEAQFDAKFRKWARVDVADWGMHLPPKVGTVEAELKAVKDDPQNSANHVRLGWARLAARQKIKPGRDARGKAKDLLIEAEAAFRNALKADPKNIKAMIALIELLEATKRRAEAGKMGFALIQIDSGNPTGIYYAAMQAASEFEHANNRDDKNAEDVEKTRLVAIAWWTVYTNLRPNDPTGPKKLARLFLIAKDAQNALAYIEWLERLEDDNLLWPKYAARIHEKAGRINKAIQYYRSMLHIDPYNRFAHTKLVALLGKAGQKKRAAIHVNALKLLGD